MLAASSTAGAQSAIAQTQEDASSVQHDRWVAQRSAAEAKLRATLTAAEASAGSDSRATFVALQRLILHLRYDTNRREELRTLVERMVNISRQLYREDNVQVARTLSFAGELLAEQHHDERAAEVFAESLGMFARNGEAHAQSLEGPVHWLAKLHMRAGRNGEAIPLLEQSLALREAIHGPEHESVARTLDELVQLHTRTGDHERALPYAQRSLAILQKQAADSSRIAAALDRLARLYRSAGQPARAVPLYEQSIALHEQARPAEPLDTAWVLDELTAVLSEVGRHDLALTHAQRSVALKEAARANPLELARSLQNLASVHFELGEYRQALPLYRRSLARAMGSYPSDHLEVASASSNLGVVLIAMGEIDDALPLLERALIIREQKLPPGNPHIATSLNNLAEVRAQLGHLETALELHRRGLAVRQASLPEDHPLVAIALGNLAAACAETGRYAEALTLYRRAFEIVEKSLPQDHPDAALVLNNLAALQASLGRSDQALLLAQRALAIQERVLPPNHPAIAVSLSNRGNLAQRRGDLSLAMSSHQRALRMREEALGPDHPATARALHNLAVLHSLMDQHDEALPLYRRSLAIRQRTLPDDHPEVAASLVMLGAHHYWTGSYEEAVELLQRVISIALGKSDARRALWQAQALLGSVYAKTGNRDLAIIWMKESVDTIQTMRGGLSQLDRETNYGFLHDHRFVYSSLADLLIAADRLEEAQIVLQMLKEQELHDSLERAATNDPRNTRIELTGLEHSRFARYYELRDRQSTLAVERRALENKQLTSEIPPAEQQRLQSIERDLQSLREAMVVFMTELAQQSAQLEGREGRAATPPALAERNLQIVLHAAGATRSSERVVALQYVLTDTRLSILLSMPGAPVLARQVEIDSGALHRLIVNALERLSTPKSDPSLLSQDLRNLYSLLIAPIETDLRTVGAKMLILVPNGALRYVPFAALMNGDRYLVQDYTLTFFNEAVKKSFPPRVPATWRPVAMGFTQPVAEENLQALTRVRDEVRTVALKLGMQGRSYLDDEFTRAVFNRALGLDFNVLHLATHFRFEPGRPDASRLFLGDRTTLTLADIARDNLRFDRFALVALSACESGVGGGLDADGRELESLGALVQNQGAQAVVATLWRVSDGSTAEWMKQFYKYRVAKKLSKALAMRAAQLSFMDDHRLRVGHQSRVHPYYWAPFVLMGDWR